MTKVSHILVMLETKASHPLAMIITKVFQALTMLVGVLSSNAVECR